MQAYLHHMPTSVQCAASDKLKELLLYIIELSTLCNRTRVVTGVLTSEPGSDVRIWQTLFMSVTDFFSRVLLRKLNITQQIMKLSTFIELQSLLLYLQELMR
jgi:hypothetical protein